MPVSWLLHTHACQALLLRASGAVLRHGRRATEQLH